ncbi:uncharacterized protein LOC135371556 isoform X2 [Ornithodoros turicata]|uniref:uncharacterized protein LOC135371556 isoform X2 n=1 Tax=Ornithodoros turicata TaxID=34597 RepID=UPI003139482B
MHLRRTAVPTIPLGEEQRSPSTITGKTEHAQVSSPDSAAPSTSYLQSNDPGEGSSHTRPTPEFLPHSPCPMTSPIQSNEPREPSCQTRSAHMLHFPANISSSFPFRDMRDISGHTEPTVGFASPTPITSLLQLKEPGKASEIFSEEAARTKAGAVASTSGTSKGTSSPYSAPQRTNSSTSGTTHRRRRLHGQRTPRSSSLIHQLQVSRDRLRRALSRSRAAVRFGGLARSQIVYAASRKGVKERLISAFTGTSHEPFCCGACRANFLSFFATKMIQHHVRLRNREAAEGAH